MKYSFKNAGSLKVPATAVGLTAFYTGALFLSLALVGASKGWPVIWLPNGFLAAGLLLLPRRWAVAQLIACVAIQFAVLSSRSPLALAAVMTMTAAGEALAVAWLTRRFVKSTRLTSMSRVGLLLGKAALPAVAVASLAVTVAMSLMGDQHFFLTFYKMFVAKALGMSVVLSTVLTVFTPSRLVEMTRPWPEKVFALLVVTALTVAPMTAAGLPAYLLILPSVLVVAFRYGAKTTTLAALIIGAISIIAVVGADRPAADTTASTLVAVLLWQESMSICLFTGLAVALTVAHQQRLKSLLVHRTGAARESRARALHASRVKTDFLATMSHEVRTPMNSILGFTQLLLRSPDLADHDRRRVNLIDRAGAALMTIVDDILDFSKGEAGQIQLNPRPTQIGALAEDCLGVVAEGARAKGLETKLFIDCGPAGRWHMADDQRLRQVLLNLLNNALKFTDRGCIWLKVDVRPGKAVDQMRFTVTDTGVGIEAECFDRLFKRFSQVDSSVSRSYGGTGLGLAIVKNLVDLMGGEIGVESVPGEGSTFWFEVPLAAAHAEISETKDSAPDDSVLAHILLVDDHAANRELGGALLNMMGCTVDLVESGREAIEAMKSTRYDAVFMDIHMPQMDGLTAARAIRKLGGQAAATPIIALTADVMPDQVKRYRKAGMVDSIGKPIRIEALHAALNQWVGLTAEGEQRAA